VPTYGSSKVKRYAYYETRKGLARPGDPPGLRFQRGQLEQHLLGHLEHLLGDEHGLRRMSGIEEAGELRTLFATAHLLAMQLREIGKAEPAIRLLVAAMTIRPDCIAVILNPAALTTTASDTPWAWSIPLPTRRPFREARIRIDAEADGQRSPGDLLDLIADAMAAQRLVLGSPELSLHQIAKREGRCRTLLSRLLRLSWLSPRIIDAIADGTQPKGLTRRALLICDMPIDWADQERQLGFAA
jgi:site-specific DNA recombinase